MKDFPLFILVAVVASAFGVAASRVSKAYMRHPAPQQVQVEWEPDASDCDFYRWHEIDGTKYQLQLGFQDDGSVIWRNVAIKED